MRTKLGKKKYFDGFEDCWAALLLLIYYNNKIGNANNWQLNY